MRRNKSTVYHHPDIVVVELLEREEQGPTQQRCNYTERRVFCRCGDERYPTVLDTGQKRILLSLGEAVNFVEEQQR